MNPLAGMLAALAITVPQAVTAYVPDVQPPAAYKGNGQPENSHPHIEVIAAPIPFVPQINAHVILHVNRMPQDWHYKVELLRLETVAVGNRVENRWRAVKGVGVWNIRDLPPVGHNKLFHHDWTCAPGTYIEEWIMSGISYAGDYSKIVQYWPFQGWKSKNPKNWKFNRPPAIRQAFKVTSRGDTNCYHSHGN